MAQLSDNVIQICRWIRTTSISAKNPISSKVGNIEFQISANGIAHYLSEVYPTDPQKQVAYCHFAIIAQDTQAVMLAKRSTSAFHKKTVCQLPHSMPKTQNQYAIFDAKILFFRHLRFAS